MMAAMSDTTPWAPHGAERTGFVERPGSRIYYEMAGDGPPLVFASIKETARVAEALSATLAAEGLHAESLKA